MALAWKAGWVQALGGSNPPTSAIALKDTNVPGTIFSAAQSVRLLPLRLLNHTRHRILEASLTKFNAPHFSSAFNKSESSNLGFFAASA